MVPHWKDNQEWIIIKLRYTWKLFEIKQRNKDEKWTFFYLFFILHIDYVKSYLIPKMELFFSPSSLFKKIKHLKIG